VVYYIRFLCTNSVLFLQLIYWIDLVDSWKFAGTFAGSASNWRQVTSSSQLRDVEWATQNCTLTFASCGWCLIMYSLWQIQRYIVRSNLNCHEFVCIFQPSTERNVWAVSLVSAPFELDGLAFLLNYFIQGSFSTTDVEMFCWSHDILFRYLARGSWRHRYQWMLSICAATSSCKCWWLWQSQPLHLPLQCASGEWIF
jgi:hypothetical protein